MAGWSGAEITTKDGGRKDDIERQTEVAVRRAAGGTNNHKKASGKMTFIKREKWQQ